SRINLALGSKSAQSLEVFYGNLGEIHSLYPQVRGILGQNFLSQFNYLLDYRGRRIEFEENGDLENNLAGAKTAIKWEEGMLPIVTESAREDGLRLALDSGASVIVLFETDSDSHRLIAVKSEGLAVQASTSDGSHLLKTGRLYRLAVGGETFADLPVLLAP